MPRRSTDDEHDPMPAPVTAVLAGFIWAAVGLAVGVLLMTEYFADVQAFDEAVPL